MGQTTSTSSSSSSSSSTSSSIATSTTTITATSSSPSAESFGIKLNEPGFSDPTEFEAEESKVGGAETPTNNVQDGTAAGAAVGALLIVGLVGAIFVKRANGSPKVDAKDEVDIESGDSSNAPPVNEVHVW